MQAVQLKMKKAEDLLELPAKAEDLLELPTASYDAADAVDAVDAVENTKWMKVLRSA